MFGIGTTELIVIFLVILLLFGGRKIPEIARGIGKGIREFKKAKDGIEDSLKEEDKKEEDKEKKQ
jgi:sec-independent protein translocase protein TatA